MIMVLNRGKVPLAVSLLSYPDAREFLLSVGEAAKNTIVNHYMSTRYMTVVPLSKVR